MCDSRAVAQDRVAVRIDGSPGWEWAICHVADRDGCDDGHRNRTGAMRSEIGSSDRGKGRDNLQSKKDRTGQMRRGRHAQPPPRRVRHRKNHLLRRRRNKTQRNCIRKQQQTAHCSPSKNLVTPTPACFFFFFFFLFRTTLLVSVPTVLP
jgi:hypothetical protein